MVVTMWSVLALAGASVAYLFAHFLLASPETALVHPDQVEIASNHYVSASSVVQIFAPDRGHSILRVPLSQRRRQIEAIPWVEHATVRRAFPNKIEVDILERTPIAFLRQSNDLALVDAHGVILDRPVEGTFHFPVVTGISTDMPPDDREIRMQLFSAFSQQVDSARPGAMDLVSEVDLSDANDLRATITGLQNATVSGASSSESDASSGNTAQADSPILVHFGDADFGAKYQSLVDNIAQWRATVGRVESVDLRFVKEAVVNPDTTALAHVHVAKLVTATKQTTKKTR
jgi:cell division protein FtsQ